MELWRSYERGEIDPVTLKSERFARFAKVCEIDVPADTLSRLYRDHLKTQGILLPGAKEVLERFFGTRTMILITNGFSEIQRSRLSASGIGHFFEDVIISEEVGVQKPDERIFQIACEKANCGDPKSALMIGDSPTSDIVGGSRSGMDTCLVQPSREPLSQEISPTYTILSLGELPAIVESR